METPSNIKFEGIDWSDYPDFCDAHIIYAEHDNGVPYSEEELNDLNDDKDRVYSLLWDYLF